MNFFIYIIIENADIILLEASITLSVTFQYTLLKTLLLLQNLLTDWDERPLTLVKTPFKTLVTCS